MNNMIVTGGLGFIGSSFVRYMLNKYPTLKIYNVDKMTYAGRGNNLEDIDCTRYKLYKYDINDISRILLPRLMSTEALMILFHFIRAIFWV